MDRNGEWFSKILPLFVSGKVGVNALNMLNDVMAEYITMYNQGKRADPYEARKLFLLYFLKNREMKDAFLTHFSLYAQANFSRFNELHGVIYVPEDESCQPGAELLNRGLNIAYNDALEGSQLAKKLFVDNYKTFYKKEYNELKKYKSLNHEEITFLVDENDSNLESLCRIACMAELLSIPLDRTVDMVFITCEKAVDVYQHPLSKNRMMLFPKLADAYDEELYAECYKKATSYNPELLLKPTRELGWFYNCCLNFDNYPNLDSSAYMPPNINLYAMLAEAIYILEKTKKDYTDNDLSKYLILRVLSSDMTNRLDHTINSIDSVLGLAFNDEHLEYLERLRTLEEDNNKLNTDHSSKAKEDISDKERYPLEEQIRELQIRIHEKDQTIKNLHGLYEEKKKEIIQLSGDVERAKSSEKELNKLREFVYGQTEEDTDTVPEISMEEMISELSAHKIAIVGGHPNWVKKMKEVFPGFRYFSAEVQSTARSQALSGIERLYFFAGVLDHSEYYKFKSMCDSSNIDYGYLKDVQIENTIRRLYNDFSCG